MTDKIQELIGWINNRLEMDLSYQEDVDIMLDCKAQLTAQADENKDLQDKIKRLEVLRPHWAKGYSSDSVATQTYLTALEQLYALLGVTNQTQAVVKINCLLQVLELIREEAANTTQEKALASTGIIWELTKQVLNNKTGEGSGN